MEARQGDARTVAHEPARELCEQQAFVTGTRAVERAHLQKEKGEANMEGEETRGEMEREFSLNSRWLCGCSARLL